MSPVVHLGCLEALMNSWNRSSCYRQTLTWTTLKHQHGGGLSQNHNGSYSTVLIQNL